MSTNLNTILNTIKTVALANGFISVEQYKINLESHSDTLLPRLIMKLNGVEYGDIVYNTVNEKYKLELIVIIADSDDPVSDLKTMVDLLLNKLFNENVLFNTLVLNNKIELVDCDLTNERDEYAKYGGESCAININIDNVNVFGGTPCY